MSEDSLTFLRHPHWRVKSSGNERRSFSVQSLVRCAKSVSAIAGDMGCEVFNSNMLKEDWCRAYISKSPNIFLTENDIGLDERIHGAVFKKRKEQTRIGRNLYLIYLSNKITSPIQRVFVLGHEIAHVLLHGRLIHPGMMLNLSSQDWVPNCGFVDQMEAEANIFALMSIIPDKTIEQARQLHASEEQVERSLAALLNDVYGHDDFTNNLVKDRLLLHKLTFKKISTISLVDTADTHRIRSWIPRDANFMKV